MSYKRPIVPADFTPPARWDGPGFHLRMLTIHDLVKDFDAVMAAAPLLREVTRPGSIWPAGLTLEGNLVDLGWHQREFILRHSFAYTVMNDDESRCLGCCYINPSDWAEYEVFATYWGRDRAIDAEIGTAFRSLVATFPFRSVAFPGRDHAWR